MSIAEFHLSLKGLPLSDELGLQLQMARKRAKMEQSEVAKQLGTHRVQVSKWERGVNRPGDETLARLAALYSTSVKELLRTQEVSHETTAGDESWSPNPALKNKIPERAYEMAIEYCRRLARAGVPRENIEQVERLMIDRRFAQANKRERRELTADDWILLIDDTWDAVRETLSWEGTRV